VAAVVAIVLVASALLALLMRVKGQADSQTLANQSRAETDRGSHDGALRLALIAARKGWFAPPAPGAEAALARAAQVSSLIADLRGHLDSVVTVAFSADGTLLATASRDHTARLWDTRTGAAFAVLKGHEGPVNAIVFSPDGLQLATASDDRTVRLWDARPGAEPQILRGHEGPVRDVKFSTNGDRIATASEDGTARLWDSGTRAALHLFKGHGKSVIAVAFSPDGTQLATASNDRVAQVWNTLSGAELHTLCCHEGELQSVVYSPNGALVATAGRNGVRLWDATTGGEVGHFEGHMLNKRPVEEFFDLKFSRDGKLLVAAGEYASALLVDVKNRTRRSYLCCHERVTSETSVWAVDIKPERRSTCHSGRGRISGRHSGPGWHRTALEH